MLSTTATHTLSGVPKTAKQWIISFVAFLMIGGAWAIGAPYEGIPDEQGHIMRAAAVVFGDLFPDLTDEAGGTGAVSQAPAGVIKTSCWPSHRSESAACVDEQPSADTTLMRVVSVQGRYHPLYYLLVGWPMRIWSGWSAIYLGRLIGTALIAGFLATAATCALRFSRQGIAIVGVLAGTTPMTLHLCGGINPNGLEIASGMAMFAAIFSLVGRDDLAGMNGAPRPPRPLIHAAGISAVVLAQTRSTAPMWLAIGALALLILAPWPRLRSLLGDRAIRWWLGAALISTLTSVAWTFTFKSYEVLASTSEFGHWGVLKIDVFTRWMTYFQDMIGNLSWLDTSLPDPAMLAWIMVLGGLIAAAAVAGDQRQRWTLSTLGVLGFLGPALAEAVNREIVVQGRYLLPVLSAVPILAAFILGEMGLPQRILRSMTRAAVLVLLPIHLLALDLVMVRWTKGGQTAIYLNPFGGTWQPQVGVATPLILMAAGLGLLGWHVWQWHSAPED